MCQRLNWSVCLNCEVNRKVLWTNPVGTFSIGEAREATDFRELATVTDGSLFTNS